MRSESHLLKRGAYIARNSFAKEGVMLDFVGLGLQMHWVVLQT